MNGRLIDLSLVCSMVALAAGCLVAVRTEGRRGGGVTPADGPRGGSVTHVDRPYGPDTTVIRSPGRSGKILVKERPPRARHENQGNRPSRTHVWVPGHWEWSGGWSWSAGFWAVPVRPGAVWVAGQWTASGDGWEFTAGFWR